jgi:preprotein translocase subunit SecG
MAEVIIVVHLLIVIALVVLVLLQKSEGGGLGMGSSGGNFMNSRGTANVLSRTTAYLAVGFFLTSLTLSILATSNRQPRSILDQNPATAPVAPGAATPQIPTGGQGVLDLLQQQRQQQGPTPAPVAPPSTPAAPAPAAPAPAPATPAPAQ